MIDIKNKKDLIEHFGGEGNYEEFLIDLIKPIVEKKIGTKLKNFFIVKTNFNKWLSKDGCNLQIFWSGDNSPECQIIYANNHAYSIDEVISLYREYKINDILTYF